MGGRKAKVRLQVEPAGPFGGTKIIHKHSLVSWLELAADFGFRFGFGFGFGFGFRLGFELALGKTVSRRFPLARI